MTIYLAEKYGFGRIFKAAVLSEAGNIYEHAVLCGLSKFGAVAGICRSNFNRGGVPDCEPEK